MNPLDYDDDDFYADDAAPLWPAVAVAALAVVVGVWSCAGRAQDFANVGGAAPVQIERVVGFTVDPIEVLTKQSVEWLCGYIAILSSARSSPTSPVHVPGQRPMKCVENTASPSSPGGTLPPPFTNARVTYAAGIVTIEAAPQFTRVELLIDSRISSPWYRGTRTLVNGRATFGLPPEALDGAEHLLDVRLYTVEMDRPHRPDGYPVRAVLAP